MPIGSADGTVYEDQLEQTIAEVVPPEVRKVFIFPKKEDANIEDRRDSTENEPRWENVLPSLVPMGVAIKNAVLGTPSLEEAPVSELSKQLGHEDIKIEPNAGQSLLQRAVDDVYQAGTYFKGMYNAVAGQPNSGPLVSPDLTDPTSFSKGYQGSVHEQIEALVDAAHPTVYPTPDYLNPPEREPTSPVERPEPVVLFNTASPLVNITDQDIDTGINVTMGVGAGTIAGIKSLRGTNYATTVPIKEKLYQAQIMEMGGSHADDIHKATGFAKGADKQWRYEISDHAAKLNEKNLDRIIDTTPETWTTHGQPDKFAVKHGMKLMDILDHPDLYEAYPHLKHIAVQPLPKSSTYLGLANAEGLHLAPLKTDEFKSIVMHEVQHFVQRAEGFARGGSPKEFMPPNFEQAEKSFTVMREAAMKKMEGKGHNPDLYYGAIESVLSGAYHRFPAKVQQSVDKLIDDAAHNGVLEDLKNIIRSEQAINKIKNQAWHDYQKLAGEVESRNVEARLDMTPDQRSKLSPSMTEDTLPSQQVVAKAGKAVGEASDLSHHMQNPRLAKIRLDQLLRDKAASKKAGVDVDSSDYMFYNNQIRKLREYLK